MYSLLAEGWRGIPHSYAVVNQRQCLEFLKRRDLRLRHLDLPYYNSDWKPVTGLFSASDEATLHSLQPALPDERFDVALRIAYPYLIEASPSAARTFVFSTCEFTTPDSEAFSAPLSTLEQGHLEIVTPSTWSKAGLLTLGADPDLVHVLPHGYDPDVFQPPTPAVREQLRKAYGWEGRFVFLHVGAMTRNKGIDLILKSFAVFASNHPEALLVLKGLDSLYQSMGLLAKRLRESLSESEAALVGERISYIGDAMQADEIAQLHQAADVYLSPYLAEGFNMPVLEAAACGLPVICTAGGPTDDFTNDSFALKIASSIGFLAVAGKDCLIPSFDSLLAQMDRAFSDEAWMRQARLASCSFVRSRFTWRHVSDSFLKLALPSWRELS